jgi:hypothetical protein
MSHPSSGSNNKPNKQAESYKMRFMLRNKPYRKVNEKINDFGEYIPKNNI